MRTRLAFLVRFVFRRLILPAALAGVAACRHTAQSAAEAAKSAPPVLYEWTGANLTGPVRITIDLSEQKAHFERGGRPAGWSYVATGKTGHRTSAGDYHINEKVVDKCSTVWGVIEDNEGRIIVEDARCGRDGGGRFVGAPMPYWMRIYGAVGMHGGIIPDPGTPASHGCIRFPKPMAEILFDVVKIGTPVSVVP